MTCAKGRATACWSAMAGGTVFVLFHKRVCGPLANSLFHHRPEASPQPPVKIETAYHKADVATQKLIDLVAAGPPSERQIVRLTR
jgi:hypothetical protein